MNLERVYVHALLDGRDTPPRRVVPDYLSSIRGNQIKDIGCGTIATIAGRYYPMDRDKRWERTKLGYDAIVSGEGQPAKSAAEAIEASYADDVSDEFVKPVVLVDDEGHPKGKINDNDAIIYFNFRPTGPDN